MRMDVNGLLSWWETVAIRSALELFLLPLLGHVLEDQDDPGGLGLAIEDGDRLGPDVALDAADEVLDDSALLLQRRRAPRPQGPGVDLAHPAERQGLQVLPGLQSERALGRLGGHIDVLLRVQDGHGVGEVLEGLFRRPLDPGELDLVDPAALAEGGGHLVEGRGEDADLVAGVPLDGELEVSLLDLLRGSDEPADRPEDRPPDEKHRNPRPDQDGAEEESVHLAAGLLALRRAQSFWSFMFCWFIRRIASAVSLIFWNRGRIRSK